MTRRDAAKWERDLKARGVYRPFVSQDGDRMAIESYPLTVYITPGGCDPSEGPYHVMKMRDCTLAREGKDTLVRTQRLYMGQDVRQHASLMLLSAHAEAHARSTEQEAVMF